VLNITRIPGGLLVGDLDALIHELIQPLQLTSGAPEITIILVGRPASYLGRNAVSWG